MATAGGHLKQLHRLAPRIPGVGEDVTWVTNATGQSRSLLAGRDVVFARYVESRDYRAIGANAALAIGLLSRRSFSRVISTGSAIALSFLPLAAARGIPCHYVESAARSAAPSLTGVLMRHVPGVRTYTQYAGWAHGPWRYAGSVFDDFEPAIEACPGPLRRAVVTLGTSEGYGFLRLVERVLAVMPPDVEVLWQTGPTDTSGLPIETHPYLPASQLDAAVGEADVVIAHAGTGSALSALEAGLCPVLVPRERAHRENVDDHQGLLAAELSGRGLAVGVSADALTRGHLLAAARRTTRLRQDPPPLRLDG